MHKLRAILPLQVISLSSKPALSVLFCMSCMTVFWRSFLYCSDSVGNSFAMLFFLAYAILAEIWNPPFGVPQSLSTVMSDTHICSGCDSSFTLRGYHSHLLQMQDPLCHNVFDRLKKSYETYQLLEQVANSSNVVEDVNNQDVDMELDSTVKNQILKRFQMMTKTMTMTRR